MDPITANKLLNISNDLFLFQENGIISNNNFEKIIQRNYKSKNLERRVRDIYRILTKLNFIEKDLQAYKLFPNFFTFIDAWNEGNLLLMNKCLSKDISYKIFLEALVSERRIKIPKGKEEKQELTQFLKEKYGINYFIFDAYRYWSLVFGQSYKSPFNDFLDWGGNWSQTEPSLDYFYSILLEQVNKIKQDSNYVNAGIIADRTCQILNISFQAFEKKINEFLEVNKGRFVFASITTRYTSNKNSEILILRQRKNVINDKNKIEDFNDNWLTYRDLNDGVKINGKLMRLMRLN